MHCQDDYLEGLKEKFMQEVNTLRSEWRMPDLNYDYILEMNLTSAVQNLRPNDAATERTRERFLEDCGVVLQGDQAYYETLTVAEPKKNFHEYLERLLDQNEPMFMNKKLTTIAIYISQSALRYGNLSDNNSNAPTNEVPVNKLAQRYKIQTEAKRLPAQAFLPPREIVVELHVLLLSMNVTIFQLDTDIEYLKISGKILNSDFSVKKIVLESFPNQTVSILETEINSTNDGSFRIKKKRKEIECLKNVSRVKLSLYLERIFYEGLGISALKKRNSVYLAISMDLNISGSEYAYDTPYKEIRERIIQGSVIYYVGQSHSEPLKRISRSASKVPMTNTRTHRFDLDYSSRRHRVSITGIKKRRTPKIQQMNFDNEDRFVLNEDPPSGDFQRESFESIETPNIPSLNLQENISSIRNQRVLMTTQKLPKIEQRLYLFREMMLNDNSVISKLKFVNEMMPLSCDKSLKFRDEFKVILEKFFIKREIDFSGMMEAMMLKDSVKVAPEHGLPKLYNENLSDVLISSAISDKKGHRVFLSAESRLLAKIFEASPLTGSMMIDLESCSSSVLDDLLSGRRKLNNQVTKICLPKFISEEVFEEVWHYLYTSSLTRRAFASSVMFTTVLKAAVFLRIDSMIFKLWTGLIHSFNGHFGWSFSDQRFLNSFHDLTSKHYSQFDKATICVVVYFVILRIVQESSDFVRKPTSVLHSMNPTILEDLLIISAKYANRSLDIEVLKCLIKSKSTTIVDFFKDRYSEVNSLMGYDMSLRSQIAPVLKAIRENDWETQFSDAMYHQFSLDELDCQIKEERSRDDSDVILPVSFPMGIKNFKCNPSVHIEKDFVIKVTVNGLCASTIIAIKPLSFHEFILGLVLEVDDNLEVSIDLVPIKLPSAFKVFKVGFKASRGDAVKQSYWLMAFNSTSTFVHSLKNFISFSHSERSLPLEIELDFIEDTISESFLCYLSSTFSDCPISLEDDASSTFPPSIPQVFCLPFPLLLSLTCSNDLNVTQESQIFYFVDAFIKRLARKTDIDASIMKDLNIGRDHINEVFEYFYSHKSEESRQALVNLMFASIRLEFVETNFLLAFFNGNIHLGKSDFRRDYLIRRLIGKQIYNSPRNHFANRKPMAQLSQTVKTFSEIVEWITEDRLHDHCLDLVRERTRRIDELMSKVDILEKNLKEKEIAFAKYRKMIEDTQKPLPPKFKHEISLEKSENYHQSLISTYCQIF